MCLQPILLRGEGLAAPPQSFLKQFRPPSCIGNPLNFDEGQIKGKAALMADQARESNREKPRSNQPRLWGHYWHLSSRPWNPRVCTFLILIFSHGLMAPCFQLRFGRINNLRLQLGFPAHVSRGGVRRVGLLHQRDPQRHEGRGGEGRKTTSTERWVWFAWWGVTVMCLLPK